MHNKGTLVVHCCLIALSFVSDQLSCYYSYRDEENVLQVRQGGRLASQVDKFRCQGTLPYLAFGPLPGRCWAQVPPGTLLSA